MTKMMDVAKDGQAELYEVPEDVKLFHSQDGQFIIFWDWNQIIYSPDGAKFFALWYLGYKKGPLGAPFIVADDLFRSRRLFIYRVAEGLKVSGLSDSDIIFQPGLPPFAEVEITLSPEPRRGVYFFSLYRDEFSEFLYIYVSVGKDAEKFDDTTRLYLGDTPYMYDVPVLKVESDEAGAVVFTTPEGTLRVPKDFDSGSDSEATWDQEGVSAENFDTYQIFEDDNGLRIQDR